MEYKREKTVKLKNGKVVTVMNGMMRVVPSSRWESS